MENLLQQSCFVNEFLSLWSAAEGEQKQTRLHKAMVTIPVLLYFSLYSSAIFYEGKRWKCFFAREKVLSLSGYDLLHSSKFRHNRIKHNRIQIYLLTSEHRYLEAQEQEAKQTSCLTKQKSFECAWFHMFLPRKTSSRKFRKFF